MLMKIYLFSLVIILLTLPFTKIYSQNTYTIFGSVIDSETKEPIAGATIRLTDSKQGTYSSSRGKFRLPVPHGEHQLKISSLGHESTTLTINSKTDTLLIKLKPSSVKLRDVKVVADIDANQVIKRAIEKKKENQDKLKTFSGLLYSKLTMELAGSVFANAEGSSNSISLSGSLGKKAPDKYKMFVLETFSKNFMDYDKKINHSEIIQRRQTANIQPQANLLALSNFLNFYDESISFITTDIITPLSSKAFDYYSFSIKDRTTLDDRYVYVIEVIPTTKVYPAFYGTIKIVEGTYNLVEVDLKPTSTTAITFVDSLHFMQKFEEINKDIWHPTLLEITAKARVDIIKGVVDVLLDLDASSIYSDIKINEPLPDSLYQKKMPFITVSKLADSTKLDFWEQNSLREITPKEKEIYHQVDSLVALDTSKDKATSINWGIINPAIDFNRVNSFYLGLKPYITYGNLSLESEAGYSLGLKKPLGNISLSYHPIHGFEYDLSLNAKVFSSLETFSSHNSYPLLLNTFVAGLMHVDYYDYFKDEGWKAGFSSRILGINLSGSAKFSHQYQLSKTTNNSIFSSSNWRTNPSIEEGFYNVYELGMSFNPFRNFGIYLPIETNFEFTTIYGENKSVGNSFRTLEGNFNFSTPTFYTGYQSMELKIMLSGGIGDKNLPIQYQFRMPSWICLLPAFGHFYSSPIGYYGGSEFFAGHLEFNTTDLWWRTLGLPLYEGRGIDLILAASSVKYFLKEDINNQPYYVFKYNYMPTSPDYYSEIGFGLSRLPTFISNVIFWRFDARWGVGNLSSGRFGSTVSVSFPF
jgi:hypothetical protein